VVLFAKNLVNNGRISANGGNGGEDCGIIMTDPNRASEWDDRECDSTRPFLCELSED
jgi:hypothetical protein